MISMLPFSKLLCVTVTKYKAQVPDNIAYEACLQTNTMSTRANSRCAHFFLCHMPSILECCLAHIQGYAQPGNISPEHIYNYRIFDRLFYVLLLKWLNNKPYFPQYLSSKTSTLFNCVGKISVWYKLRNERHEYF